jgi:hypothetical protein
MRGKNTRVVTLYVQPRQDDEIAVLAAAAGLSKSAYLAKLAADDYARQFGDLDPKLLPPHSAA